MLTIGLDSADVETITNQFEADSLRIQPLGFDSNDSIYWYFFGMSLLCVLKAKRLIL